MAGRLRMPTLHPRDEARMTLIEHLEELRSRLFRVGIAFFLVAFIAWFFRQPIYDWFVAPAPQLEGSLYYTALTAPIITDLKLTLYAAFMLTLPIVIYQAWAFVAPAVGDVGRTFTYILIALSSLLFLGGVAFGYYLVLPIGVDFLLGWGAGRYEEIITADLYLAFVSRFLLAFGIVFELPAATYVGAKLGIVSPAFLRKYRRHAIVVNAILAAALTPGQDPFSMILMAIPMIIMYEVSIVIARFVKPFAGVTVPAEYQEEFYGDDYDGEGGDHDDPGYPPPDDSAGDGDIPMNDAPLEDDYSDDGGHDESRKAERDL